MYDFHYNIIKKQYGEKVKLLFTDTDSLCYEIETENVHDDMCKNKVLYDFNDYSDNHEYYIRNSLTIDKANKKIIGNFKNESNGILIIEFIERGSNIYSIKLFSDKEKKRAKGIKTMLLKMILNTLIIKLY